MTQPKKVLGRGLGALIPGKAPAPPLTAEEPRGASEVDIDAIEMNPYQPRKHFAAGALDDLERSVREHGIVQPLIVTRIGQKFQLIAGERRYRAAQKAGLKRVPVVVKDSLVGSQALELALIENIQREDLNPLEEAVAYQQLHAEFGLTQDEIAKKVGKERSTVANFLRLLKLPDKVKSLVAAGQLSMGHARALLAIESAKQQESLADRIVRQNLNVRQTELLAQGTPKKAPAEPERKDVFTADAEERLTTVLRTRVQIERRRRGGSIVIRFSNEDDLIRLYDELAARGRKA